MERLKKLGEMDCEVKVENEWLAERMKIAPELRIAEALERIFECLDDLRENQGVLGRIADTLEWAFAEQVEAAQKSITRYYPISKGGF